MKKFIYLFAIVLFASCSNNDDPKPELSEDAKALKLIVIKDFVGEWEYYTDKTDTKPYKKIIINKVEDDLYNFKLYVGIGAGGSLVLDTEEYKEQNFSSKNLGVVNFAPAVTIQNLFYVSPQPSSLRYDISEGRHLLSLSSSKFYKK